MPADYRKVLDYWAGKGPRPTAAEAEKGLMEFANNLKLENCIYHKDVIDAMFRQVESNDTKAFASNAVGKPILAVNYDMGRNRYAYMDKDTGNYWVSGLEGTGNQGHMFRNDGVDIGGDHGNYFVDQIESGEWMKYTVTASRAGTYSVVLNIASTKLGGKAGVSANGAKASEAEIPETKDRWQKVPAGKVILKKGQNAIVVTAVDGGFKLQSIEIER